jgi:hypothetical protein
MHSRSPIQPDFRVCGPWAFDPCGHGDRSTHERHATAALALTRRSARAVVGGRDGARIRSLRDGRSGSAPPERLVRA